MQIRLNHIFFKLIFSLILTINLTLTIIGTFYVTYSRNSRLSEKSPYNNNAETTTEKIKPKPINCIERFFACFSIIDNSKFIQATELNKDSLEVIHGIRAIGMIWIIIGHIFFYAAGSISNLEIIFTYADKFVLQPLFTVALAVDSYFVVSGLLLSFLFFQRRKKNRKENEVIAFFKSVINRYLRLTPSYLVVFILTTVGAKFLLDKSQYFTLEKNNENCSKYWWRNFLYINNFYPMSDMCMSWSWYLSVDFQCFTISSLLLITATKFKKISLGLFGAIFAVATAYNGYIGYQTSYSFTLDSQYKTIDQLYTPTGSRIGPYFIGVFVGWFLSHYDRNLSLSKVSLF